MDTAPDTTPRQAGPAAKRIALTLTRGEFTEADITEAGTLQRKRGGRRVPRRQVRNLFQLRVAGGAA